MDTGAHPSPSCSCYKGLGASPSGLSWREWEDLAGCEGARIPGLTGRASGQTPGMLALFSCINKQGGALPMDEARQGSFSQGLVSQLGLVLLSSFRLISSTLIWICRNLTYVAVLSTPRSQGHDYRGKPTLLLL